MYGTVSIEAETLEDAIRQYMKKEDILPLPNDPQYIDGSFKLSTNVSPYHNLEGALEELKNYYFLE